MNMHGKQGAVRAVAENTTVITVIKSVRALNEELGLGCKVICRCIWESAEPPSDWLALRQTVLKGLQLIWI